MRESIADIQAAALAEKLTLDAAAAPPPVSQRPEVSNPSPPDPPPPATCESAESS